MLNKKSQGFTLIELSIVLVIISLIVGGVIGGKSLIYSARISQQVAQLHEFRVAYNNFQLQYDAMPGDFLEATSFWPSGGTANGDGDGMLERSGNSTNVNDGNYNAELPLFFQHLSLADLVSQKYDGSSDIGKGYPALGFSDGFGLVAGMRNTYETLSCAKIQLKLYLQVGLPVNMPALGFGDNASVFKGSDAKRIDRKLDDGMATTGAYCSWNANGDATGTCHNNGAYNVASQSVGCRSSFRL